MGGDSDTGNTKELAARLMAVQACYQMSQNDQKPRDVMQEYLSRRGKVTAEDDDFQKPDGALFKRIMTGIEERVIELDELLYAHIRDKDIAHDAFSEDMPDFEQVGGDFVPSQKTRGVEPLLRAIFLCAICELLMHQDIDYPIIINDYLHITHAFYGKPQVSFVNGVLDSIAILLRADAVA